MTQYERLVVSVRTGLFHALENGQRRHQHRQAIGGREKRMKIPERTMATAIYHARKIAEEKNIPEPTEAEVLPLEKRGQFYVFRFREWMFVVEEETGTCWPIPHSELAAFAPEGGLK